MKQRAKRKQVKLVKSDSEHKFYDYRRNVIHKNVTTYNTMQDDIFQTWCDMFTAGWCDIFAAVLSKKLKLPIEGIFEERFITSKGKETIVGAGLLHAYVLIPNSLLALDVIGPIKTENLFDTYGFWPKMHETDPYMWINPNSKKVLNSLFSKREFVTAYNFQTYRAEANRVKKKVKKMVNEVYLSYFRKEILATFRDPNHQPNNWYDYWMENKPV